MSRRRAPIDRTSIHTDSGFILQWRRGPGRFATSGARGPGRFATPGARGPQRTGSYLGGAGSAALARNRIGDAGSAGAEPECTYAQVNMPQINILNRSKRYIQGSVYYYICCA